MSTAELNVWVTEGRRALRNRAATGAAAAQPPHRGHSPAGAACRRRLSRCARTRTAPRRRWTGYSPPPGPQIPIPATGACGMAPVHYDTRLDTYLVLG